jgi:hypothetical protein
LDPWDTRSDAGTSYSDGGIPDLRNDFRGMREAPMPLNPVPMQQAADLSNAYIWGTTINVQTSINEFK